MKAIPIIAAVLAVLNLLSFCLMAYDKRLAKTGRRRVPEKRLASLATVSPSQASRRIISIASNIRGSRRP